MNRDTNGSSDLEDDDDDMFDSDLDSDFDSSIDDDEPSEDLLAADLGGES